MKLSTHIDHAPIIPPERETIVVLRDDDDCYTDAFGRVYDWQASQHVCHHPPGHSRMCVHRLTPPQPVILMGTDWVTQLHWQMRLADFALASRVADVVTVAFDVIGPTTGCHHKTRQKPENRWQYRLYHMRWWDQDDLSDQVVLGVWVN